MDVLKCKTLYGEEKEIAKDKFKFRPSVYAIIIENDHLLTVTSKHTNTLMLPGGGIHIGEPIEEALKREVKEETGIEIEVLEFIKFRDVLFYYDPQDKAFHSFAFYYHCKALSHQLKKDDEIIDDECVKPNWIDTKILKPEMFNNFGHVVMDIIKSIKMK